MVLRYACLGLLLLLGELPLLLKFGRGLWEREQYQFFPLMIFGAAWVGYERWQDDWEARGAVYSHLSNRSARPMPRWATAITVILLTLSLATVLIGGIFWIRLFASVSTVLLLAGVIWHMGRGRLMRTFTPSLILLAVIIPPPAHLDENLTLSLQNFAVTMSSHLLYMLHVPHVQSGNILEIAGRQLLVQQACSGINSLMSILGFSLLFTFWKRRAPDRIIILLAWAFCLVICGNLLRITGEAWLKVRCHIDVLDGSRHEMLGMVVFVACAGLVVAADALLESSKEQRLRKKRHAQPSQPTMRTTSARASASENIRPLSDRVLLPSGPTRSEWAVGCIFLLAGCFVQSQVHAAWPSPAIRDDAVFELPSEIDGWQRVDRSMATIERPQTIASKSSVWMYRRGDIVASIAIDYPFMEYHELTTCYSLGGWSIDSRFEQTDLASTPPTYFSHVDMTKTTTGDSGYLIYGLFGEDGHWLSSSSAPHSSGLRGMLEFVRRDAGKPTYQVQALVQARARLPNRERGSVDQLFSRISAGLSQQALSQMNKN